MKSMDKSKDQKESDEKQTDKKTEPSTSGSSRKAKRKSSAPVEPRTPLKRQRAPVERFQSPAEDLHLTKPKTPHTDDVEVVYKKGIFLAVRGDEESFYLCRTQQNVFNYTKKFKIQWLDMDEKTKCYKYDFLDSTDIECVLTNIKMDRVARETFKLPADEKSRIEMILTKAIRKEKGMPIDDIEPIQQNDDEMEEEENELDEMEDLEDDEPDTKKQKVSKSKQKHSTKGKQSTKKAAKVEKKTKKDKEKSLKRDSKKEQKSDKKRGPDKNLRPNFKIKVIENDPLFETKDQVPFISKRAHTKLIFRAVLLNDLDYLKTLLEDDQHIYNASPMRSIKDSRTPLQVAVENNNVEMMKELYKDIHQKENKRLKQPLPPVLVEALGTGSYNPVSLGVSRVRTLTASRGSKEGNAAFIKDTNHYGETYILPSLMKTGVKKETVEAYTSLLELRQQSNLKNQLVNSLELAILQGNLEIAGYLVKQAQGMGYNYLHENVLTMKDEDLRSDIRADSVKKKPKDSSMITPLHCACINPNKKYIERLLSIEPDINLADRKNRKPIHYAACCQETGPLEVLIEKGANPMDASPKKCTPLFYACSAGRPNNADFLLKKCKTDNEVTDPFAQKYGVGGINHPNWESVCPVHVAAETGNVEVMKVLLKHGVNVNKPLSAGKEKVTALMIAAGKGNLEMVRLLVQKGAVIEQRDKYKRTALTHAVMNGSVPVVSYLLYLGADPNTMDSSGNTLVHYATAYGWYFVLKLLVNEGGADPKVANEWKVTPVGVAFMKGHVGLVDFLLKMPGVDINFQNDTGMTLLCIACSSKLQKGLVEQIKYLLKKGADPTISDINGYNALHYLATNDVQQRSWSSSDDEEKTNENMSLSVEIAEILIEAGCKPTYRTNNRQTAITLAIKKVNIKLISYLAEKGGAISAEKDNNGDNALHSLASVCLDHNMSIILRSLCSDGDPVTIKENGISDAMEVDSDSEKALDLRAPQNNIPKPSLKKEMSKARPDYMKIMVTDVNHSGYTPLLVACEKYATASKKDHKDLSAALKNGREFIKALLDISGVNPSQIVEKKHFEGLIPEKETEQYTQYGKYTPTHFMIEACTNCEEESCGGINLILSYKPNLEIKNVKGETPLALAVLRNSTCSVDLLLKAKANPNVNTSWKEGETLVEAPILHTATRWESVDIVDMLLAAGCLPDGRNSKNKRTCLHAAVCNRRDEVVGVQILTSLIKAGADVNAADNEKRSPLHLAMNSNRGTSDSSTDYEEVLLGNGADIFQKCGCGKMPIHYAFQKINSSGSRAAVDPIDLLGLITNTMKDQMIDEPDSNCQSPLHMAAQGGATISCLHLIKRKADINRQDKDGNTPLSLAVSNGHDSCAIILIQNGADVKSNVVIAPKRKPEPEKNKKPVWKWKPLVIPEVAPEKKTFSVFQTAIQKELQGVSHMVLDVQGKIDGSVIEAALRVNQYNVALRLLRKITDRSLVQISNKQQQNLFHVLALYTIPGQQDSLQLKVAQMLYDKGVSLSQTDENGCTPLHYAALTHQQYELAKFFTDKDSSLDLNKKDKYDRSVLAAFFWDHQKVTRSYNAVLNTKWLELFLSKGCSLDTLFDLPLPDVPVFDMLCNTVSDYFTTACEYRISPLIFAINFCEVGILRFLLENGANCNFADSQGLTPLMHAVKKNDLVMVKILLNTSYKSNIVETKKKPSFTKQMSRNVFFLSQIDEDGQSEKDEEETSEKDEEEDEQELQSNSSDHDTDDVEESEDEDEGSDLDNSIGPEKFPSLTSQPSQPQKDSGQNKEEFETVEKTNDINVNATDSQGWTAAHHLVCPLDYGTFDNEEMLYVLAKAGADITKKDNAGLSPLDHALIRGAIRLARRLQTLSNVETEKMEKPVFPSIEVKDSLPVPLSVDYKTDAVEFLKSIEAKDSETSDDIVAEVDYCCEYKKIVDVLIDETQKIPYDVTLSKVDVSYGEWGMYNFYRMQVVHHKVHDIYILFTRWGRIGDRGQYQHTPFQKKSEAITEFGKIFRSKTGNFWSNVKSFEKQPKKYQLIEAERKSAEPATVNFNLSSDVSSKLPSYVQDLIKEMSNVKMMEAAINKIGLNYDLMPFGRIKKETLIKAQKVLNEIGGLIKEFEQLNEDYMAEPHAKNEKLQKIGEKITLLSNSYYHYIPQKDFVFDKLQPVGNRNMFKKQQQYMSNLLDIECAEKIIIGAQSKITSMNPLDYIYQAIGCKIQLLSEDCVESQYILKYIHASYKDCPVKAIYKLSRPGEDTKIRTLNMENHRLLWHGSSMSNFISILHRGLLVAPPEAPVTGALFGEGLYSSDAFDKCQGYSYNSNPSSNTRLALLCQVAMGNVYQVKNHNDMNQDLTNSEYHCKLVEGRKMPDKDFDVTLPYGAVIPVGQLVDVKSEVLQMPYREYIVNDSSQVCLRYLVEFSK